MTLQAAASPARFGPRWTLPPRREIPALVGVYVALLAVVAQTIYPLVWVFFGSLKERGEFIADNWGLPAAFRYENYVEAWRIGEMGERLFNSALVTGLALAILLVVTAPCAYAVARMRFPGRKPLLVVIVAAMLVPPQVTAIPLFTVARDLGLLNSRLGLALIYAASGLPLSVFILRGFLLSIPLELEDAARVDGASRWQVLTKIMLPLARPGLGLVVILQFIEIWNDFFLAFLLLRDPALQTIPLGLVNFFQRYESQWHLYFAALIITTLPVIVVFVLMQRQFIAGLTAGAVKG